ncbi:unnamed protein product (macronuclear) [Paramecium tetraurelia]|uniref:Myb-like DNA-binding domain protein n=1 Tax=Paramecium tetraurelia TaxID=5888 RepID=A0DXH4_PARTE|nr:uncharacterized protein GSPATT00021374001 [Paramecium tetraurelia]CAK87741.1 unnamed protein product [Paramecium tetraurelia]|eukprot:XP_001455138.1 hypothetical protein (macronuclear) [Paramecium tetraurelia strain d4-2]
MRNSVEYQDESCIKMKIIKKAWSTKEDNLLKKGIRNCGMNWIAIADYVPNRNPNQCAQRWKRLQGQRSRTNQFWKPEEDQLLLQLISQYGMKWSKIAQIFKNRNSKQCRNRFINALDPNLKQNSFTQEEDQLIYQKYIEYGSKWSQISKFLMGRSDNQIKNRFYNNIRSQYLQIQNPYYSKQTQFQPKEQLEHAREEHLRINGSHEKEKLIEDQNDMQTKDQDISRYINEENYSNFDQSFYSNMDFEYLSTSNVNIL